jgi:hypothetical protein
MGCTSARCRAIGSTTTKGRTTAAVTDPVRHRHPDAPPRSVYQREADVFPDLEGWIAELFHPANLDATCSQLVSFTNSKPDTVKAAKAHHVLRQCDLALRRYRATPEQGANGEAVGQWINGATAKEATAQQRLRELRHHDEVARFTAEQVRDLVGRVGATVDQFARADPANRAGLYQQLGIDLIYKPTGRLVLATADLGRHTDGVGGGLEPPPSLSTLGPQRPNAISTGSSSTTSGGLTCTSVDSMQLGATPSKPVEEPRLSEFVAGRIRYSKDSLAAVPSAPVAEFLAGLTAFAEPCR